METNGLPELLVVDIVSDIVCPWCYIGLRRLDAAERAFAARYPGVTLARRWHPFELNPDLPPEGVERRQYVEQKFGGAARSAAVYERVRAAGASEGLHLDFDRIGRQPNTRDAHRLVAWAQQQPDGDVDALVDGLFRAFFVDGRFVGDHDVLADVAAAAGFDAPAARAMLAGDAHRAEVEAAERRAYALGVQGVPFFILGGKLAVSGAQSPDVLADAMAQAAGVSAGATA